MTARIPAPGITVFSAVRSDYSLAGKESPPGADTGHWFDPLADAFFKTLCKTPAKGVQPAMRALSTAEESSRYFVGKADRAVPRCYLDPGLEKHVWDKTE